MSCPEIEICQTWNMDGMYFEVNLPSVAHVNMFQFYAMYYFPCCSINVYVVSPVKEGRAL